MTPQDAKAMEPMPCPWCGDATPNVGESFDNDDLIVRPYVVCAVQKCLGSGPVAATETEAIAAWNRVAGLAAASGKEQAK